MLAKVVVLDYGMGNLDSVVRAIEMCRGNPLVSNQKEDIDHATHIILPGVGAFADGMENLKNLDLECLLWEKVIKGKTPFLGVCLGMQLLATKGWEGGKTKGLGWIEGEVVKFSPTNGEKVPHVGWNEVHFKKSVPLFEKIPSGRDFYFVHSYYFRCDQQEHILTTTPYCGDFASAICKLNIYGVQFHPEKSQQLGLQVIKNFLAL